MPEAMTHAMTMLIARPSATMNRIFDFSEKILLACETPRKRTITLTGEEGRIKSGMNPSGGAGNNSEALRGDMNFQGAVGRGGSGMTLFVSHDQRMRLSKLMAFILRHDPEQFGLKMNEDGFVSLADLVEAIGQKRRWVTEEHIRDIVESSEKKRFEIRGEWIRASYGHSRDVQHVGEEREPPEFLYHGTAREFAAKILQEGLWPMGRRYVHLSTTLEAAWQVGRRRDPRAVVLLIRAHEAAGAGVRFFLAGDLYLTAHVPSAHLALIEESETEPL